MTPSARLQASIELLDEILQSWRSEKRIPADKIIDRYFKDRRFIGSKDRQYVGELCYWVLRNLAAVRFSCPGADAISEGRLLIFTALIMRKEFTLSELRVICDGSKYAPHTITPKEREALLHTPGDAPDHVRLNYPEWMEEELRKSLKGDLKKACARCPNKPPPTCAPTP